MPVVDPRSWMDHLPEGHCWDLLATAAVGRIAVLVDGAPEVYPVNIAVDDRTIVFRTGPGSKLHGIERSPTVCVEVDDIDLTERGGWSVVVKGLASEITEAKELRRLAALPLDVWVAGDRARWIRVQPREVTGRALRQH